MEKPRIKVEIAMPGYENRYIDPRKAEIRKRHPGKVECDGICANCDGVKYPTPSAAKNGAKPVNMCICYFTLNVGFICNECGECL